MILQLVKIHFICFRYRVHGLPVIEKNVSRWPIGLQRQINTLQQALVKMWNKKIWQKKSQWQSLLEIFISIKSRFLRILIRPFSAFLNRGLYFSDSGLKISERMFIRFESDLVKKKFLGSLRWSLGIRAQLRNILKHNYEWKIGCSTLRPKSVCTFLKQTRGTCLVHKFYAS